MNIFCYIKVNAKGLLLVLLPLMFGLVFIAILTQQLNSTARDLERLKDSQQVLLKLNDMVSTILGDGMLLGNFQRGNPVERQKLVRKSEEFFMRPGYFGDVKLDSTSDFKELFEDAEASRKMFLKMVMDAERGAFFGPMNLYTNKDREQVVMTLLTFGSFVERIKSTTVKLGDEEPAKLNHIFMQLILFLVAGFFASCTLSFLIAYIFTFDIVKRLGIISTNAYLIAAGKELPEPLEGTDEIAELDRTLHKAGMQLKAFQKKELAILNNAADVVTSLDRRLRILAIGESAERIWGYAPDDLIGRSIMSILSGATAGSAPDEFEAIAKSGMDTDVTTIIKCKDGTLKDFLWTVNWSAEAQEFVCVVHDITAIKTIEKLKQAFFSMVSHDLRTPLASMNVNIANLSSGVCGPIPEGGERLLKNAASNMERLSSLVNDLLELDKLDSDKLTLDLDCISLREVCETSVQALESMAGDAGVKLIYGGGDAAVMADERRLVQVVTNLISNAIKFSPKDGEVTVAVSKHGENCDVRVSDQGPGIAAEQIEALFDKYKQGTAKSNISLKGTGLGLAIVKSIVKAHGGEAGVDSEIGKGSTFWVRLTEFVD